VRFAVALVIAAVTGVCMWAFRFFGERVFYLPPSLREGRGRERYERLWLGVSVVVGVMVFAIFFALPPV
jgi:hypothetical protein